MANQADHVIIDLLELVSKETLESIVHGKFYHPKSQLKHLKKIEFRMDGKYHLYTKTKKGNP